jgi:hypothetical protein
MARAKLKLFQVDLKVAATAYIKAYTKKEAGRLIDEFIEDGSVLEVEGSEIFGESYHHPRMPIVSLSPAMTIHGRLPGSKITHTEDLG